jgi:hypothetical protein
VTGDRCLCSRAMNFPLPGTIPFISSEDTEFSDKGETNGLFLMIPKRFHSIFSSKVFIATGRQ